MLETLEDRVLLYAAGFKPTTANLTDALNGPMANVGQTLISVYSDFEKGLGGSQLASKYADLRVNGNMVGVDLVGSGNFNNFVTSLENLGVQVNTSSAYYGAVEGWAPISALPAIAEMPQTLYGSPNLLPKTNYQGIANNEADASLKADVARATYNVTGAGVTVGVLSDSVSQYAGGLADSYKTGDLNKNAPVNVIQDGPAGGTDEGRAMLENIHDIAPGASLAFASADYGPLGFGQNIVALQKAGAKAIVDDVSYSNEPFFQDGYIAQGVNTVVAAGTTYFSAAANQGNQGYLSTFRPTAASVANLGAATYMNFNPGSGAALTELPITVGTDASANNPVAITFEFDQPYAAQEPAGSTAVPTSQVEIYILDANGNVVNTGTGPNGSSNGNVVAQGAPIQFAQLGTPGNYFVVVKVASGASPGHVEFVNENENATLTVSQQFGSSGGTYYPTSSGHETAINTIGVGAMPWWASTPFLGTNPLNNEPWSSFGPGIYVFKPDGTAMTSPVTVQNPTVTGPDGGNTSFFPPGGIIDTSNPPFPGEPATPTNLSQNLPSFFGTSSASPNVTAVAALLLQKQPNLTVAQIKAALISGATTQPMNGSTAGTWDLQGGYGLVNASSALAAIDVLRVISTTPANAATVTTTPTQIIFTFNKPIVFSSINASDLTFSSYPANLTGAPTIGTPIAVDDPVKPTQVAFPYTFSVKPNTIGNGTFSYTLAGAVVSTDGKALQSYKGSFTIADTIAPRVANTKVNGRVISVVFNEAMSPSTITLNSIYVVRQLVDGSGNPIGWQNLNNYAGATISYNPSTFTASLDYNALLQSQLPAGKYYLIVKAGNQTGTDTSGNPIYDVGVTDIVGNKLDGEFSGVFPSGDGDPKSITNPTGRSKNEDFIEFLSQNQTLIIPQITSLKLLPQYDTGIVGDENTNINQPVFIGQVYNDFPGSLQGLTVLAEFNSLHGGTLDLASNGRGWTGNYDVKVSTDINGTFQLPAPFLPEGFTSIRLVVIAQSENPPLAGLSSQYDHVVRIDQSAPKVVSASLAAGGSSLPLSGTYTALSTLTSLSLDVQDPNNPPFGALATPTPVYFPALDPSTASNISNYSLINTDITDPTKQDYSRFIATAKFVATGSDYLSAPNRTATSDPYYGRIDLTFSQGLPRGHYIFTAHSKSTVYSGITDAAANPIDDTSVAGEGTKDFTVNFNIQPEPVYVVTVAANVTNAQGNYLLPYSYYEVNPRAGDIVSVPPTSFTIDFSNPLDPTTVNNNTVQIVGSANTAGGTPDGDFGTLGQAGLGSSQSGTGGGYNVVAGTTVTLGTGPYGTNTRLTITLASGTTLAPDHYRLYMPNSGAAGLKDIYGNQLDGEFLGDQTASALDLNGNPQYEDLMPTGQYRLGMSGDAVAGGAFQVGFLVVPTGNIVYARPDYVEDPLLASTTPDGSLAKPYSVLAPQAYAGDPSLPTLAKNSLNNGDPNGGLNDGSNFLSGFNSTYDRAGIGKFARSAFYAASQLSSKGPVVIVALPGTPQRDPITGVVSQKTFVLQAPAGSDPVANDGSGSVPFDTLLVFNPGATLKLQNASLFVQNQGSALQAVGGANPNDQVNFTSYSNDAIAGDTNNNGTNSVPRAGDWGGIVYRNYDQAATGRTSTFPVDVTLIGVGGGKAISGEDDSLSRLNFASISYGGGAVPATRGLRYDEVMLYNSRPAVTNTSIIGGPGGVSGSAGGSQAAISGDLDSFREDDLARGPLIRRTTAAETSINGIWVRPLLATGVVEATDAVPYTANPVTLGGTQNYTFDDPLPYVFTSVMYIGRQNVSDNYGVTLSVHNRLYIQPGMMLKFEPGSGILIPTAGASMIVGDRTYISRWDAEATIDPTNGLPTSPYGPLLPDGTPNPNFKPNTVGDAQVVFTSALDNKATTAYIDPLTGVSTTIVPAIDVLNTGGIGQPSPGNVPASSRWGYISYNSGSFGTFDEATVEFAGGRLNIPGGTTTDSGALNFTGAAGGHFVFNPITGTGEYVQDSLGTRLIVTNNNFYDNADVPMSITPDGLLAANTLEPLSSGHPYFRGNILQRNAGANGLYVKGSPNGIQQDSNVDVNSLWDATDLTYIVRETIVLASAPPIVASGSTSTLVAEPKPSVVLTIQSALPGTLLADGSTIPNPGQSVIIKLDNHGGTPYSVAQTRAATLYTESYEGAGFVAGVDNGVDPTADPYVDVGAFSQMRFLGIGGNQTTGQQRIPVVITSIHDSTVGNTVRGIKQFTAIDGDTTAPKAGDGGVIYFGGNELPNYNILDPRAGSLMDNVDVKYITRIEMQGGGLVNYSDLNASNSFDLPDDPYATRGGIFPSGANGTVDPRSYITQFNAEHALMISNCNLSNFSDGGVFAHPGFNQLVAFGQNLNPFNYIRSGLAGQPNLLLMMNDTIANMPIGVQMVGDQNPDSFAPEANEFLSLNNTFYNDPVAVDLQAIAWNPGTPQVRAHIHFIAMDNIFDGSSTTVVRGNGMLDGSQMQYNLFFNDAAVLTQGGGAAMHDPPSNFNPVNGDPQLVDPTNGNFQLGPNSAAIDAARSELDLLQNAAPDTYSGISTTLLPDVTQVLDPTGNVTGIRDQTSRVPDGLAGGFRRGGGSQLDPTNPPTDVLTLPGYPDRGYVDLFVPTLATDPQGQPGPTTVPGSWVYKPLLIPAGTNGVPGGGERDIRGYLRIDDPNKPNVGYGSRPFFDIGAYEYVPVYPPHVTAVAALVTDTTSTTGTKTINLYTVGTVPTGTNKPIQTINVQFDHSLDPTTVNGDTVLLEASGGDGIFGNNNNPNDKFYNLSGKVSFNATTNVLTINVGAAGLTLQSDEYRLFLIGTGSVVLRDPQGNALDGENTVNGDPNGAQLALPSGDGFPGGNFYDTFIINTNPPAITPGSFALDSSADTNVIGDLVTKDNLPAFSGTVKSGLASISPAAGQTVYLDISTRGDGVFDRLNAGTALTNAQGAFTVTVGTDGANTGLVTNTSPLPDSLYTFNSTTGKFSGYTLARIRVVDQSGNTSNLITDPLSAFKANGAVAGVIIDTAAPRITGISPLPNTTLVPDPATGVLYFRITTDKYIYPPSLSTSSIIVTRAGADGILGTKDDVTMPIAPGSIATTFLSGSTKGAEAITFLVASPVPNDQYQVTLKGTGTSPIIDVAGNALAGRYNGSFPTGQDGVSGTDFNPVYVVYNPNNQTTRFVGDSTYVTDPTATLGSRANPYPTIAAAIAASNAGDRVGVLPGVYTESITLKPFVKVISASASSTDTSFALGNAQQTVIRAPYSKLASKVTVTATNLAGASGVDTELAGFTIASPMSPDPALGPIDPATTAVLITNSDVLLDRDYVIDAQIGVHVVTSGTFAATPRIYDDGVIGNINGIVVDDQSTSTLQRPTQIINDTIAFNTLGVQALNSASTPLQADIYNNIFWQNHDLTTSRAGTGIISQTINKLLVEYNMFQGNGASDSVPADNAVNVGNGFSAAALKSTPDALGNFIGTPAFVSPRDPRPNADGPGRFFLDANFDLTVNSAAIDSALNSVAPAYDFLNRGRVKIAGKGFPGTGPADIGAFEYKGSNGITAGGAFRVVTTSLSATGAPLANGATFPVSNAPMAITVTFSGDVNTSSVTASDLILSGSGIKAVGGARATSVTWINNHTVQFNLSGGYNSTGTVNVTINAGAIQSTGKSPILAFSDSFKISSTVTGKAIASLTPAPAASPTPAGPRGLIKARATAKVKK